MIHLLCALQCEAAPVIRNFCLDRLNHAAMFPVYLDNRQGMSLTISGVGRTAAATATMYTGMLFASGKSDIWINAGTAGHADIPIGQTVLADKITEKATGRTWYPQILIEPVCPTTELITLDVPSAVYQEQALFDMEASGFYETVCRFATAELCHSLKIVSDNRHCEMARINAQYMESLIAAALPVLETLMDQLAPLAAEQTEEPDDRTYLKMIADWRFSHTQQLRLKKLLQRWNILLADTPVAEIVSIKKHRTAHEVLDALQTRLDQAPLRLHKVSGK